MNNQNTIIPIEKTDRAILTIRGQKVMLDTDLAEIYGVNTKQLNQAVKRNLSRFPKDFMFQLTTDEKEKVVTNCDHLHKLKYSSFLPYAFTEHGTVMLASILNSPVAIAASIQVVRAFVRLRELLNTHKELAEKLTEMEQKYDRQFKLVFDAIRRLMEPPTQKRNKIGFKD